MAKMGKKEQALKKVGSGEFAKTAARKSFGIKVPGEVVKKKGWISNECTDGSTSDPIDVGGKMKKKLK